MFDKPANPNSFPLMQSPVPVLTLVVVYLLFVLKFGKILMRDMPPYNLKKIILTYNALQVCMNSYMLYSCTKMMFFKKVYDLGCIISLPMDHPMKPAEMYITYLYFINKILDLMDTVFFVLRKSFKQITVLHVYHHIMMVLSGYFVIYYYGFGGHSAITGTLNTFVHVVMYGYYFVSALQPGIKQSLWWKKYITVIQLVQFVIIFLHTLYPLLLRSDCQTPKALLYMHLVQSLVMVAMFTNFYVKTYLRRKSTRTMDKTKIN